MHYLGINNISADSTPPVVNNTTSCSMHQRHGHHTFLGFPKSIYCWGQIFPGKFNQ